MELCVNWYKIICELVWNYMKLGINHMKLGINYMKLGIKYM